MRLSQLGQLKALLRHALASVPHYTRAFAGLDPDNLDWATFASLPRIDRPELQARFATLRSRASPATHGQPAEGQSSGSTGTPIRFLRTGVTQFFWQALTLREHLWQQRDFSGKLAAIRVRVQERHSPN